MTSDPIQPNRALFVDIGGVLLTNGWDTALRKKAAQAFDLDFIELNERHHLTFADYEEGGITLDEYLKRVVFYRERTFSPEVFKNFILEQARAFPEMLQLVKSLKQAYGLKIVTISNEGRELMLDRVRRFQLDAVIDVFIVSCFVHERKPDFSVYQMALDISQVPPEAAIYIEDREMFVQVARSMGYQAIHHVSFEDTRAALASLGLSVDKLRETAAE